MKAPFFRLRGMCLVPSVFPTAAPRLRRRRTIILSESLLRALCDPRAGPTARPGGDHRTSCPRHHRAGGRPGSWPHHGSGGGPLPAVAPGLADLDELGLRVADDAEGGPAVDGTRRISVDGRRRVAKAPSLATSWTLVPAARAILPPWPAGARRCGWWCQPGCSAWAVCCRGGCRVLSAFQLASTGARRGECSAFRRRHSAAVRCGRNGSGRIQCRRPGPGRRPSREGSRWPGTAACARRRDGGWSVAVVVATAAAPE